MNSGNTHKELYILLTRASRREILVVPANFRHLLICIVCVLCVIRENQFATFLFHTKGSFEGMVCYLLLLRKGFLVRGM